VLVLGGRTDVCRRLAEEWALLVLRRSDPDADT
jgi:hypothetical protein